MSRNNKGQRIVWVKVTDDDLELPVAIADTARELAELCGTTENGINSTISHAKKYGYRCHYKKVVIEEDNNGSKPE